MTSGTAVTTPQIKNLIGRVWTNKRAARALAEAVLHNFVWSSAKQQLEIITFAVFNVGSRAGAMVGVLASHRCVLGSILR